MNKKVALICDTHIGVRNGNPYFLKKQKQFFDDVFFPYVDEHKIDTLIHLGDVFDKRSSLNYTIFDESKMFFFDGLKKRNMSVHIIVGNHDVPYRNTNYPNSPELLLKDGYNFKVYPEPTEVELHGQKLLFIPWVNVENNVKTGNLIRSTNSRYLFGHLEIIGFQMLRGQRAEKGFDRKDLSGFDKVFSGHFHHRSQEDNIWYLGNPYETTWADYDNQKGFHILDLEDHSLELVKNPYTSHLVIDKFEDVTEEKLDDMIVKIDLTSMTEEEIEKVYKNIEKYEKRPETLLFVNKTNFVENAEVNTDDLAVKSTKDIMYEYIESMEIEGKKYDSLKELLGKTYDSALELK